MPAGSMYVMMAILGAANLVPWMAFLAMADFFRALYAEHCGVGAKLIVVPFNQGSSQDVRAFGTERKGKEKRRERKRA